MHEAKMACQTLRPTVSTYPTELTEFATSWKQHRKTNAGERRRTCLSSNLPSARVQRSTHGREKSFIDHRKIWEIKAMKTHTSTNTHWVYKDKIFFGATVVTVLLWNGAICSNEFPPLVPFTNGSPQWVLNFFNLKILVMNNSWNNFSFPITR